MTDYIPFVNSVKDSEILRRTYSDCVAVRCSLQTVSEVLRFIPAGPLRWIDPVVEGLHRWPEVTEPYKNYIARFPNFKEMAHAGFQQEPKKDCVESFVFAVLDAALRHGPSWLSVPQLPFRNDVSVNKVNRQLAACSNSWKRTRNFQGKLILPVVFTHQRQVNLKTERNRRVAVVKACYELSGANGVWVVDSTLSDQDAAQPFEHVRFPGIINFHQELAQELPREMLSVAGPYWGLNLILWARALVRYPAIGLGNAYQYHLSGGVMKAGKERIAIPPLRRWVIASPQVESWLKQALTRLPHSDSAYAELSEIAKNFSNLRLNGRMQVADFYKKWFHGLAQVPDASRPLALYQDLSSAYVLGKSLPDLPRDEGTSRKPWRVAKQFMVNCL
jgi:hypothetical protein